MIRESLRTIILRDLRSLQNEVAAYPDDTALWKVAPGISNSAGTLVLHLTGNLRHFTGAVLGNTGYVRDRQAEFSTRDLTRAELSEEIHAAMADLDATFDQLSDGHLEAAYPIPVGDRRVRTIEFMIHLAVHLTYHLGQIDYHRRLLTPGAAAVDTISIRDLTEMESIGLRNETPAGLRS